MRYIYLIKNALNQKVYVGQTGDLKMRWQSHLSAARTHKGNHPLYNAMKNNIQNFSLEILEECVDEICNVREIFWIQNYRSTERKFGYNLWRGNLVFHRHTDESKAKISAAMKNRVFSLQHRQLISKASLGRRHTLESRQKMSKSKKGKCPVGLPQIQAKRWAGEGNPRANTTNATAQEIRAIKTQNPQITCAALARQFNISYKTVYGIIKGTTYLLEAHPVGFEPTLSVLKTDA